MRSSWLIFAALCFSSPAFAAAGAWDVHAGNDFYRKGKYKEALEHYEKAAVKNPQESKIDYDQGVAAYKVGDHQRALEHFQKSLLTDDDALKRNIHFNLGDTFYRLGESLEDKNIENAMKQMKSSLESFEKARAIDPKDPEALHNYEFVKKELERLKEKQQQQQQQKQQQKGDQQKKDQSQDQPKDNKPQDQKSEQKDQQGQKDSSQKDQEGPKNDVPDKNEAGDTSPQKQDRQDSGENKDKGEQKSPERSKGAPDQQESSASSGQDRDAQISSQKEANDAVDDFERNELPKGFLNFIRQDRQTRPVEKDW